MSQPTASKPQQPLQPLAISCTGTDCEKELHCFKQVKSLEEQARGTCFKCGADLVDWNRVHARNVNDASFTFQQLKHEWVRHQMWHRPLDETAVNHALRKGRPELREWAAKRIQRSIGP